MTTKTKKISLKIVLSLLVLAALAVRLALPCSAAQAVDISQNPRVLFLGSYNYEWESVPKHLSGITDTLNGYAMVDYVFMDTKRLEYEDVKEVVYQDILSRSESRPFDYVIAADDAALMFVLEYKDELFSGIPVVFEGINDEAFAYRAAEDPLITGIVETFPLEETIALALNINPDAAQIVGITDDTVSGQGSTTQFFDCQKSFPDLTFSTLDCSQLTCAEIGDALAGYTNDTILIYLMMTVDANGNTYSHTEATEYTTSCANIPVYKADELGLGVSILGGVMVSYHDMASAAAAIVLALAQGGDISDYPVQTAPVFCAFDAAVMARFGITKAQVAAAYGGKIEYVNDQPSFFQIHKNVIIPSGIIIALLIAFSVFALLVLRSRKKVVAQLEDRERGLNSLLENIPGGLAIYRIRKVSKDAIETLYSSQGIPKLSGRTMQEYQEWIKGGLFENTVSEQDLPRFLETISACVPEKKPFYLNYNLKHKDGSLVWVSLSAVWGYDEKDGSRVYYAVYLDMSEQRKAQQAQREAMQAKASNDAKSDFLSRMSHDIRTPLNAVLGFISLALDEPDIPAGVAEYLENIDVSSKYLLNLINDVLDMAKIESGKVALHEKSVDGPKFLNSIARVFRAQAAEKGIKLITDFSESATPWVMMDELRSRQIYANLLSNAIKFSQSGTEIRWTVKDTPSSPDTMHMLCTVSDQGCGIRSQDYERIFQSFEQTETGVGAGGTGLGLPIVKNLVELMGGTIRVGSELNVGTTFTFELDRKLGQPQEETHPALSSSSVSLRGHNILLCEDNHINTIVAKKLLEKAGCTVDTVENGKLCVDRFKAAAHNEYDAILMDIRMPVMNGLGAAAAIRALKRPDAKTVPIVAMSANAFEEDVRQSLAAGMNAHLSKPIDPQVLYHTLDALILHQKKD